MIRSSRRERKERRKRGHEEEEEERGVKCIYYSCTHIWMHWSVWRDRRGGVTDRQTDKESGENIWKSQWHQFASQLSNDGFCMTRQNLRWRVSSFVVFLYVLLCCCFFFFLYTILVSPVLKEFTCGPGGRSGSFVRCAVGPNVGRRGRPMGEWGRVDCGRSHHQFIIEFLLRVMKKTWLLPPERTDAKNT